MKSLSHTNIVAEMQAIANALHIALAHLLVQQNDDVLIQTDCIAAIDAFEGKRRNLHEQESQAVSVIKNLRTEHKLKIVFRHVKGHTNNTEARFVTNKMCDKRAKSAMRQARARIQNGDGNESESLAGTSANGLHNIEC